MGSNAHMYLAEAQIAAGQVRDAERSIQQVLADPYLEEPGVFELLGVKAEEALASLQN